MASCRAIKGVLHNFLGTFTSRYSDYKGYWLFGFLVNHTDEIELPLLNTAATVFDNSVTKYAAFLAMHRFREQADKSSVLQCIEDARMTIRKSPVKVPLIEDPYDRSGNWMVIDAVATSICGKRFQSQREILVAAHNPANESRRVKADRGGFWFGIPRRQLLRLPPSRT